MTVNIMILGMFTVYTQDLYIKYIQKNDWHAFDMVILSQRNHLYAICPDEYFIIQGTKQLGVLKSQASPGTTRVRTTLDQVRAKVLK